jgi:hypothetical protein
MKESGKNKNLGICIQFGYTPKIALVGESTPSISAPRGKNYEKLYSCFLFSFYRHIFLPVAEKK